MARTPRDDRPDVDYPVAVDHVIGVVPVDGSRRVPRYQLDDITDVQRGVTRTLATDAAGAYRSWRISDVQYKLDAPVNAHIELFNKYTDADVHNLMAYLQSLR